MELDQILCEKIKSLPLEKQKELLAAAESATLEMQVIPPIQGVPIGTILAYGGLVSGNQKGALANAGWLICDGDKLNRTEYSDLFAVIGTSYGGGDGVTTYNLPDLRGQFVRGVDQGAGRDPDAATRTASLPGGNIGDNVGSAQENAFKNHNWVSECAHTSKLGGSYSGDPIAIAGDPTNKANKKVPINGGSTETRPKNIYVNWIIKAKDV